MRAQDLTDRSACSTLKAHDNVHYRNVICPSNLAHDNVLYHQRGSCERLRPPRFKESFAAVSRPVHRTQHRKTAKHGRVGGQAMATLSELLGEAVQQTLRLQDKDSEEYRAWLTDPTSPFSLMVPAAGNSGSYPTTAEAMSALATIADTVLANDAELQRTISRDTARMEAARTLGELLPTFAQGTTGNEWSEFRSLMKERLRNHRSRFTHYMPVWLFLRQEAPAFSIGPISFMRREGWLDEIERRRGKTSSWMPTVRDIWSGVANFDDVKEWQPKTVARAVHPDQWVATVTIDGFEPSELYNRAVLTIRVALDALRLLMPSPQNRRIAIAADHGPPLGVDRLTQIDGEDLMLGSSLNLPGVGGAPGMAASLIQDHQDFLQAAGRRIEIALAVDPLSLAGRCPTLSDRWVNAAHWFGRACRADVDFAGLVMLVFSMDVLSGGLEACGITELLSRLLGIPQNKQALPDGATLVQLVTRCYGYRSEIAHGSILAIDKNLSDERMQAEQLARPMLIQYAIELDKYAQAGRIDDRDAFRNSLGQP